LVGKSARGKPDESETATKRRCLALGKLQKERKKEQVKGGKGRSVEF